MSALDDAKENLYWEQVVQGMVIAVKILKAQERLERVAVYKRWEKHWRTRLAKMLCQIASRLALPEPEREEAK